MRRYTLRINHVDFVVDVNEVGQDSYTVTTGDGRITQVKILSNETLDGSSSEIPHPSAIEPSDSQTGQETVVAPMPGLILSVAVAVGAQVKRGDTLVILEAMKMENAIRSPVDGVVTEITATAGEHVEYGGVLVKLRG